MGRLRPRSLSRGLLIIGFALHNVTEGFGIAAPLASAKARPSWGFLALAGVIGGRPICLSRWSAAASQPPISSSSLTLPAGVLIYVLNEMFGVRRRMSSSVACLAHSPFDAIPTGPETPSQAVSGRLSGTYDSSINRWIKRWNSGRRLWSWHSIRVG